MWYQDKAYRFEYLCICGIESTHEHVQHDKTRQVYMKNWCRLTYVLGKNHCFDSPLSNDSVCTDILLWLPIKQWQCLSWHSLRPLLTFDSFAVFVTVPGLLILALLHLRHVLVILVLQQLGFLCHQRPGKGEEWKDQDYQECSTEDEPSPPRPYPLRVTWSDLDLKAKHIHVVL